MSSFKSFYLLLIITFFTWQSCLAQKGYIILNDTTFSEGYLTFDSRKPFQVEFQIAKGHPVQTYQAAEVTAFGDSDGSHFYSRQVAYYGKQQAVFMKLLEDGPLKLYKMHNENGDQFYLEKDEFLLLSKENLIAVFSPHTADSSVWQQQLPSISLNERSLGYAVRNINKNRNARLSQIFFGPSASFSLSTLRMDRSSLLKNTFSDYSISTSNPEAGFFAELPVWSVNNLVLHTQLNLGKMQFDKRFSNMAAQQNMELSFKYLRASLLPRYYLSPKKLSFFAAAGPEILYLIDQSSELVHYENKNYISTKSEYSNFFNLPGTNYGLNIAAGMQFLYRPRHYMTLGLNNTHTFGKSFSLNTFSTTFSISL